MRCKQNNSLKTIEGLNSDDELPDQYLGRAEFPVYLDNDRFKEIEFMWIHGNKLPKNLSKITTEEPKKSVRQIKSNNKCIVKGTLNKCDILCLKSVEKTIPNDILVWFAKFLIFKDMQSHFSIPKSCLVSELVSVKMEKQTRDMKMPDKSQKAKYTYRVIIGKEC